MSKTNMTEAEMIKADKNTAMTTTAAAGRLFAAALALATVSVVAWSAGSAFAADPVKIGVIYPLTGNSASAGQRRRTPCIWPPTSSTMPIPN